MKWYKDRTLIDGTTYSLKEQTLHVSNVRMEDEGVFECVGENRVGKASKLFKLKIITSQNIYTWAVVAIALVIVLTLTVFFVVRFRQVKRHSFFS